MSFKISTNKKTGVVTVDSSKARSHDWLVVVFENGDTLKFRSVPSALADGSDPYAGKYYGISSPQKPKLWVDDLCGNPPSCVKSLSNNVGVPRSKLGIALSSELVIGGRLGLSVTSYRPSGLPLFSSFAKVTTGFAVREVFETLVPHGSLELVPTFIVS